MKSKNKSLITNNKGKSTSNISKNLNNKSIISNNSPKINLKRNSPLVVILVFLLKLKPSHQTLNLWWTPNAIKLVLNLYYSKIPDLKRHYCFSIKLKEDKISLLRLNYSLNFSKVFPKFPHQNLRNNPSLSFNRSKTVLHSKTFQI